MGSHRVRHDWSDLAAAATPFLSGNLEWPGGKGGNWDSESQAANTWASAQDLNPRHSTSHAHNSFSSMGGYPHTPLLGLFSSLMVVLRVGDGPKEPQNSPYHLRRLASHYPPTGTSFCAKGPADLLFIPSSSKIQAKISTSGECGTAGGAGVLAPTQLGELATGHVLTRTRVRSCSRSCTCGQQAVWSQLILPPWPWPCSSLWLYPCLVCSWSISPSQLRGYFLQEAFQKLPCCLLCACSPV